MAFSAGSLRNAEFQSKAARPFQMPVVDIKNGYSHAHLINSKNESVESQVMGRKQKQSTAGIRWWSPTQLLTGRHMA